MNYHLNWKTKQMNNQVYLVHQVKGNHFEKKSGTVACSDLKLHRFSSSISVKSDQQISIIRMPFNNDSGDVNLTTCRIPLWTRFNWQCSMLSTNQPCISSLINDPIRSIFNTQKQWQFRKSHRGFVMPLVSNAQIR